MITFIALLDYTDQGIRNIKDSPHRADHFNKLAEKAGAATRSRRRSFCTWEPPGTCARRLCAHLNGPTLRI